jgi:hypothetical protein
MIFGNMPGFFAEAALRSRGRVASRLPIGGVGLGFEECTADGSRCLCQGYDDCIHMLVITCGSGPWTCSDAGPICMCDPR